MVYCLLYINIGYKDIYYRDCEGTLHKVLHKEGILIYKKYYSYIYYIIVCNYILLFLYIRIIHLLCNKCP